VVQDTIYTWKDHNEILFIDILNKQKCLFSKIEDRKIKQELSRGLYLCVGVGRV
jgi:hypothetical protein